VGLAPPLLVTPQEPLLLGPGTYWLVASAPDSTTWAAWNSSPVYSAWPYAQSDNGGLSWDVGTFAAAPGVFRITGEPIPVPVPGVVLLGVTGLTFAGWRLRRRAL
jgi:hypothetical protein